MNQYLAKENTREQIQILPTIKAYAKDSEKDSSSQRKEGLEELQAGKSLKVPQ